MTSATTPETAPGAGTPADKPLDRSGDKPAAEHHNEVQLVGRVSAEPEDRELPSGARLVTLRVVVDRPPPRPPRDNTRRAVDVIDVACWTPRTQRSGANLRPGDVVRVEGALRRRFFSTGAGRGSRYEVEAERVVRVSRPTRAS